MKIRKYFQLLFPILLFTSCNNSTEPKLVDSENFVNGVINLNFEKVNIELSKLLSDLTPKISTNDQLGQAENINILIERINSTSEKIVARLVCYACIKTEPLQSEILVTTDSSGVTVKRTIDILTPSDSKLSFWGIHY